MIKEAKALGARQFVVKPLVIERLKRLVQESLPNAGQPVTAPCGTSASPW